MSPDPFSGSYSLANPQSMNRYSYVLNNSLSSIDPLGFKDLPGAGDGGNGDDCDDDFTICVTADPSNSPGPGVYTGPGPTIALTPQPGVSHTPNQSLCDSLNPPPGPINYSASAQANAKMGLWGW
jgi:hypothetical protein